MKQETQQLLLRIKKDLAPDQQSAFVKGIGSRFDEIRRNMDLDPLIIAKYTLFGAATGAVLDLIPGVETLFGVDGFIDVGSALGAFVGLAKSEEERRKREALRNIIIEELNRIVTA